MDPIAQKQEETIAKYKEILRYDGERFRQEISSLTKSLLSEVENNLSTTQINGQAITEVNEFIIKKDAALSFWDKILSITKGVNPVQQHDHIRIPSKIALIDSFLGKLQGKEDLSKEEVYIFLNCYRSLFEVIIGILAPHFKTVLKKAESDYIDWRDISQKIQELTPSSNNIFSSMNGQLRNAIAHESYILTDDAFYWIKDTGELEEYPLDKVCDKLIDLVCLMSALYWALSKKHCELQITAFKKMPVASMKQLLTEGISKLTSLGSNKQ